MIEVYINSAIRSDVEPRTGGSLEQTAEHTTSSNISVKIPVASAAINTCDYIEFVEDSIIIFAGTVLGIQQQDMGYSGQIDYKIFDLTIASNADFIASKFVDMTFPAGASIKHIIQGNHIGDDWYIASLGEFYGVFTQCIATEDITLGVVDDFTTQILEETSYLWGMCVADLLDQLCSTAGAWWEITPDKVFSMRYTASRENTPFILDKNAQIFDLSPSDDAYTMYSGVRVTGGLGKGQQTTAIIFENDPNNPIHYIGNTLYLRYPVHSFDDLYQYPFYQHYVRYADGQEVWDEWKIGFKGIHDNDDNYQLLATYGSNELTLKSGYAFIELNPVGSDPLYEYNYYDRFIRVYYYPLLKMYTRLIDDDLINRIKLQRGGTGLIEKSIEDDSLTTFLDTASVGRSFLRDNAKQAKQVTFKTNANGFLVGQHMAGDLEYYNISGDYQVSSIKSKIVTDADNQITWEYEILISSALYRDSLKNLFYSANQIKFKIGTDFPVSDGRSVASEIEIRTTVSWYAYHGQMWSDFEASYSTWSDMESQYSAWSEILMIYEEDSKMGNFLTPTAKETLAKVLNGQLIDPDLLNITGGITIKSGETSLLWGHFPAEKRAFADGVETVYYIPPEAGFQFISDKILVEYAAAGLGFRELQLIPLVIDKTATNPQGPYALTIVKRDVII